MDLECTKCVLMLRFGSDQPLKCIIIHRTTAKTMLIIIDVTTGK